mmetsp:Transcript_23473/g.57977  ORF Transcript_23473/g.57977 Transcript_23473/m.57977 type:complete len:274 (+) Transcript_23473:665-1486(+)
MCVHDGLWCRFTASVCPMAMDALYVHPSVNEQNRSQQRHVESRPHATEMIWINAHTHEGRDNLQPGPYSSQESTAGNPAGAAGRHSTTIVTLGPCVLGLARGGIFDDLFAQIHRTVAKDDHVKRIEITLKQLVFFLLVVQVPNRDRVLARWNGLKKRHISDEVPHGKHVVPRMALRIPFQILPEVFLLGQRVNEVAREVDQPALFVEEHLVGHDVHLLCVKVHVVLANRVMMRRRNQASDALAAQELLDDVLNACREHSDWYAKVGAHLEECV